MGYGPATGPTLKTALCYTCPVVGRMTNTEAFWVWFGQTLCVLCASPVGGSHSADCTARSSVPLHWSSLWTQGAAPPGFYSLQGGKVYRPAPEPPILRGMRGACGLQPCAMTHLKNGLVPDLYAWWGVYDKYRGVLSQGQLEKTVAGKKEYFQRRNSSVHFLFRRRRRHSNSTWNWFHVFNYGGLFSFCWWGGILSPRRRPFLSWI